MGTEADVTEKVLSRSSVKARRVDDGCGEAGWYAWIGEDEGDPEFETSIFATEEDARGALVCDFERAFGYLIVP